MSVCAFLGWPGVQAPPELALGGALLGPGKVLQVSVGPVTPRLDPARPPQERLPAGVEGRPHRALEGGEQGRVVARPGRWDCQALPGGPAGCPSCMAGSQADIHIISWEAHGWWERQSLRDSTAGRKAASKIRLKPHGACDCHCWGEGAGEMS